MKKRLSIFLCIVMVVMFSAGCSNKVAENKTNGTVNQETAKVEIGKATTEDVQAALKDANSIVVDARINDAYNGWALEGVSRGGHIPGATDFTAAGIISKQEDAQIILERSLENKGLTSDKKVIVYDANGKDAQAVAEYLIEKGIKNISTYDINEWVNNNSLEMESYPNYELIVPASVVNDLLTGKKADTFEESKKVKVVEVSWGTVEESGYLNGHLPTAFHINTDWFEPPTETDPPEWRLGNDKTLIDLVLKYGIVSTDTVITYSQEPMAAYRFATILHYLGVKDVRVMNGAMNEWNSAGYALEKDNVIPESETDFGAQAPVNTSVIDTVQETQELLKTDDFVLVDNRTWKEYIGVDTGYSYHKIAGRIEGAVFGYSGEDGNSSSMTYYRNADWTMRNGYEILEMWKDAGIDTNKHLSFMCGGGWRAAEVYWFSRVMGIENSSLFSDGWCAWSNDGLPFITGEPK